MCLLLTCRPAPLISFAFHGRLLFLCHAIAALTLHYSHLHLFPCNNSLMQQYPPISSSLLYVFLPPRQQSTSSTSLASSSASEISISSRRSSSGPPFYISRSNHCLFFSILGHSFNSHCLSFNKPESLSPSP